MCSIICEIFKKLGCDNRGNYRYVSLAYAYMKDCSPYLARDVDHVAIRQRLATLMATVFHGFACEESLRKRDAYSVSCQLEYYLSNVPSDDGPDYNRLRHTFSIRRPSTFLVWISADEDQNCHFIRKKIDNPGDQTRNWREFSSNPV